MLTNSILGIFRIFIFTVFLILTFLTIHSICHIYRDIIFWAFHSILIFVMYRKIQNKGREKKMVKMIGAFSGMGEKDGNDDEDPDGGHDHSDGLLSKGRNGRGKSPGRNLPGGKGVYAEGRKKYQEKLDRLE